MAKKSRRAYEIIEAFTKEGLCEVKQRREDGGLVLFLEYAKTCSEHYQDELLVAFLQAAPEFIARSVEQLSEEDKEWAKAVERIRKLKRRT